MIANRIILIVSSLLLTYFVVWLGEGFQSLNWVSANPADRPGTPLSLIVVVGFALWVAALVYSLDPKQVQKKEREIIVATTNCTALWCGALAYGNLVTPVATGVWWSSWLLLVLAPLCSMTFAIRDCIVDIARARRDASAPSQVRRVS